MTVVLDASAILAVINDEPGAESVARRMADALASAVNVSEVAARLDDYDVPAGPLVGQLSELGVSVVDFDAEQAVAAGLLRKRTRSRGLSIGDRACLALATQRGLPAITADRAWADLDLGVEIELIR